MKPIPPDKIARLETVLNGATKLLKKRPFNPIIVDLDWAAKELRLAWHQLEEIRNGR